MAREKGLFWEGQARHLITCLVSVLTSLRRKHWVLYTVKLNLASELSDRNYPRQ
jgi:hypothetical protein